jgi:TRAP-type C4-dicarboxylate transport system permease small subunit
LPFAVATGILGRIVVTVVSACRLLTLAIMAWIASILVISVVLRFAFNLTITWVGESCSLLLVWLMLSVAPLGFHEHFHIAIDAVTKRASHRVRLWLALFASLCTAAFFSITLYFGILSTISEFQVRLVSLPITRGWFTVMLPLSSAAVLLVCLDNILTLVRQGRLPGHPDRRSA